MKIFNAFIIISLVIITICTVVFKPEIHKHFILETAGFKLEKNTQVPTNLQSTTLFQIGDVQQNDIKTSQSSQTLNNNYSQTSQTKIIPSSLLAQSQTSSSSSVSPSTVNNSDEALQDIENMLNNNAQAWADMERKIHEERDRNSRKAGNKDSGKSLNSQSSRSSAKLRDTKYRDELIAWNVWRSNIQNRIMDTSDVLAGYGTIFYFSFNVDKNRHISNIRVICTDFTNYRSINAVKRAIINLDGNSILTFPKNSTRTKVEFTGGFMIADYVQYSTPDNYNDFEHIRVEY